MEPFSAFGNSALKSLIRTTFLCFFRDPDNLINGLTKNKFAYLLTTFPPVPEPVKDAARNAYRDVERGWIE
jgi:hypothetical protein